MHSMGSPHYQYRPWSEERRAKARKSHHKRLGNKPGHWRVYGEQVPFDHVHLVRKAAAKIAAKEGYELAALFVRQAKDHGWQVSERPEVVLHEVPRSMFSEPVAATLGVPEDDHHPYFRTAMMLVAPMFVEETAREMARWTGYTVAECEHVREMMIKSGCWPKGRPDRERYVRGGDKPGLKEADLLLTLDTLLCCGEIRCVGGDRWCKA